MGTTGKQGLTTPPQTAPQKQSAPAGTANTTRLRNDTLGATEAFARQTVYEKRPYFKAAFANPYNLSLFLGGLLAAGLTLSPFLAVIVVCLEILWVVFAPGSKLLQRLFWDPQFEQSRLAAEQSALEARIQLLPAHDRERVAGLVARHQEIDSLAAQNPSFTGELLRTELGKTDRLVDAFVDMAITCARYEQYLDSVNVADLDTDRQRWERIAQKGDPESDETKIARKNLAIIMKRIDKMKEIQHYLSVARGQLSLIENSFQLIADQIVTMQSPHELTGQLDELLDGVDSIKQTAADTERLLNPLGVRDMTL